MIIKGQNMSAIEDFIDAVQGHHFVEAHEILEHDWKDLKKAGSKDQANILKGLINGTTAIALHVKGKKEQCTKIWSAFDKYKILLDTTEIENKERYIFAKELLEEKYEEVINR